MYIIKNLPALLSLTACVAITISGINKGIDLFELSFKLVIAIIVFSLFGTLIRGVLIRFFLGVLEQSEKKARMIREAKAAAELSNTFNKAASRRHETSQALRSQDEEELEPYVPQKM